VKNDPPPRRTRTRFALLLAVAAAVAAAGFAAWWMKTSPVRIVTASAGSVPEYVDGPGTVQARVPLTLSARVLSTVVSVEVDVGDTVSPGQRLVTLDARDLAARHAAGLRQQDALARQVEAAEAGVHKAKADFDLARARQGRDADLHGKGFVSTAALDISDGTARAAAASLRSAEAALAARRAELAAHAQELAVSRAQVGFARLDAPMPAIVVQRLVEPGTTVSPGTPILRLVDPSTLWVSARIDEALVERVQVGQRALIRLRSGSTLAGRVERVTLQSDAATRELEVNVRFAEAPPRVAIDQEAQVRIEVGHERGVVVPALAVTRVAGRGTGVWRVDEGRATFVPVRAGPDAEGAVIVREGIAPGDTLLADGSQGRNGLRVRPATP
jgi:HlyD family secretion protein